MFIAVSTLLASSPLAQCIELNLKPAVTIKFDQLGEGQAIDTLSPPWTGADASLILAVHPEAYENSSMMVITAPGTKRLGAFSPPQTLPPSFTDTPNGSTLYFSAWLLRNRGGGNILFNSNLLIEGYASTLGGFGITGGPSSYFTYFTDEGGSPGLASSSIVADRHKWYEIVLAVKINSVEHSSSVGYLYYRALGETEYNVLPEFNGVRMSWWGSEFNATHFTHFRIHGARNNIQIDNLSVGNIASE